MMVYEVDIRHRLLIENWRGGSKPPRQLRLQSFSWPFALEAPERRSGVHSLAVLPAGGRYGFADRELAGHGFEPPRQLRLQSFSWPFALEAPERRSGVRRCLFRLPAGRMAMRVRDAVYQPSSTFLTLRTHYKHFSGRLYWIFTAP
jgi:hypothetical protein